jgi:hypothetical protein
MTIAATPASTAITPSAPPSSATDRAAWICSWLAASKRRLSASLGVVSRVDMKPTYPRLAMFLSLQLEVERVSYTRMRDAHEGPMRGRALPASFLRACERGEA